MGLPQASYSLSKLRGSLPKEESKSCGELSPIFGDGLKDQAAAVWA